jgi:hypothetical protein
MTEKAEGSNVVEVALTAPFYNRQDVIGIPEAAARGDGLHAVEAQSCDARGASRALEGRVDCDGVGVADSADAAVAGEDLIAEVARVGAEAPLVDAIVAAEGAAALGKDLKLAPTAERKAVRAFGERLAGGAASLKCSRREHGLRILLLGEQRVDEAGSSERGQG